MGSQPPVRAHWCAKCDVNMKHKIRQAVGLFRRAVGGLRVEALWVASLLCVCVCAREFVHIVYEHMQVSEGDGARLESGSVLAMCWSV